MVTSTHTWTKGRGKLGVFDPLIGRWQSISDSPRGKVICTRTFTRVLEGAYVELVARWEIGAGSYEEIALFGKNEDGTVHAWSFTSDGKRSEGAMTDVSDLHPEAIGFEFDMPAGLARQAYWPNETGGVDWVVESKGKKGWNRFTHHHYVAVA